MPLQKLSSLCENILIQNYQQLSYLGDTRYELIKKVLGRFNSQQLMDLERKNPKLLLDDEETWFNLVKKEFPQDLSTRFTTNYEKIKNFYRFQLDELNFNYNEEINLDNYIHIEKIDESNIPKYKLPSKLLYLKYKQDYIKKEELAIVNLRNRMAKLSKDKQETKIIHIDDVIEPIPSTKKKLKKQLPERSKLFMKSVNEIKYRNSLFKNPLGGDEKPIIRAPKSTPFNTPKSSIIRTSTPSFNQPTSTSTAPSIPTSNLKPSPKPNPIRPSPPKPKKSSIFNISRRPRKHRLDQSPKPSPPTPLEPQQQSPPRKKININEYKSRKL
ncbi:Elongin-A [Wickerhamomyces ciferrii]|uniref:Elongin-A n=1 Tax=Wickerhamomyces ciferrii (strain ATCC 14091 / BCRC 22168 / CBS 111 / JCM 3599 / NBRC 0793 / NRRL Y-1031 F-60-10) TaxID=1206466 RepID=K0L0J0_WICCF|nr:Elongin-A [Wickerhamomyces ciferrii]CCH46953.1 Elongin-A [Wickerhamomyces ciferrii]